MNACLQCRRVKMKCRPGDQTGQCERCTRKSLKCVFEAHRRGRKPGTRVTKSKSMTILTTDPTCTYLGTRKEDGDEGPYVADQSRRTTSIAEPESLQPSGVLNHEAMSGRFSLQYILQPCETEEREPEEDSNNNSAEDPIQLGLVNLPIARCLYEYFITTLNPFISQLDPIQHSLSYVRQKSSFLLTAILAMSAKTFNPNIHMKLHEHAESLLANILRSGEKSTETAQAILILTYWKEPRDTRAWALVGYVIRICLDMGWHRLSLAEPQSNLPQSEREKRERRNVERTWYVLYVYDQSLSLQTGRPSMIERDCFIESIEAWCGDPFSDANDSLLGAFVTLRLITSEAMRSLGLRSWQSKRVETQSVVSLLELINGRLERWEKHWIQALAANTVPQRDTCHTFMVRFYGAHARLQLFSLPLQNVMASGNTEASFDLGILWTAYSSAISILDLISQYASHLYFVQDSVHVMSAYSAAFLVKLVHSAPSSIARQIESNTVNVIRAAASAFSEQASTPESTCALQARFLNKITLNMPLAQKERPHRISQTGIENTSQNQHIDPNHNHSVVDDTLSRIPGEDILEGLQTESDFVFADETWANVFASAGFSTRDGIFLA